MSTSQPGPESVIFCPKCGQRNLENNFKCTQCGFVLHGVPATQVVTSDATLGGLIPYKNGQALAAYYCGIFSLIPCLGLPLAVAGIVLGILGLRYAKKRPESKGKAHAWAGIIIGSLVLIVSFLVIILMVIGAAHRRR